MQANNEIKVASIAFRKGDTLASVCTDGEHHAAIWNGEHKSFTSLWWAVEYVFDHGFVYDFETIKLTVHPLFDIICRPRGYSFRRIGYSWYFYKDNHLVRVSPTQWEGMFQCVRDCYSVKVRGGAS